MVVAPEARGTGDGAPAPEATNTLIITKVPPALLSPAVRPSLREYFERFGQVEAWVPLTGFERIVVVYTKEEDAESAKQGMDHTLVEGFGKDRHSGRPDEQTQSRCIIRVYRALPTPLETVRNRRPTNVHLPVPDTDKNFLISPPGSPPVGWESIREDPPNATTLADDLAKALESLASSREGSDDDVEEGPSDQSQNSRDAEPRTPLSPLRSPRDTLIVPHRRTDSGNLPSVLVSDTDVDEAPVQSTNGLSIEQAFSIQRRTPTSRPPGPISNVKATVESMQDSFTFPSTGSRIDRTPRPPLQTE